MDPGTTSERKQVTVLFADVMGSMDLAERFDAERWREIMDELFRCLGDSVRRFEGTVDKFTGDGIMALFGAPVSHEDHAQRACWAALDMQDQLSRFAANLQDEEGVELALRIGLNSGEVIAGSIGDESAPAYTAVGHAVGMAQRMESLAEPHGINLSESTAALVRGQIELNDLGEFQIKGSSTPRRVFSVVRAGREQGWLDTRRARGRDLSLLVGRENELAQLESLLERTLAGDGGSLSLRGEPGVGKSRLSEEFLACCRGSGTTIYVAQCRSHTRDVPMSVVLQLARAYFGISDDETADETRAKISSRLAGSGGEQSDVMLMNSLLGVANPDEAPPQMNPEARQRRLFELLLRVSGAGDRPVVHLIEDLQWIDATSETYVELLGRSTVSSARALLVNYRPEYAPRAWSLAPDAEIALTPLQVDATRAMIEVLLGDDDSLAGLAEQIAVQSAGNPFFAEEIVYELSASGRITGENGAYIAPDTITELGVPVTVQALLASRIDRLQPLAKKVVGVAAVAGAEVGRDLLAEVLELVIQPLDDALIQLIDADLLVATGRSQDDAFDLRHPLTREVCYRSQLKPDRAATHAKIAAALQSRDPARLDELAPVIGNHYEAAGDLQQAAIWHARAAAWIGLNDPASAHSRWKRVKELTAWDGQGQPHPLALPSRLMLSVTGARLGTEMEHARQIFDEGMAIAEHNDDVTSRAILFSALGQAEGLCGGDLVEMARLSDRGAALTDQVDDRAFKTSLQLAAVYPRVLAGRFADSLEASDRVLELTADDPLLGAGLVVQNPRAFATVQQAFPLLFLGRLEEGRAALDAGERISALHDRETLGWCHQIRCAYVGSRADAYGPAAQEHARKGLEIADMIGDTLSRSVALSWWGHMSAIGQNFDAAWPAFERALEMINERRSGRHGEAFIHEYRSRALFAAGDPDAAAAEAATALDMATDRGIAIQYPSCRRALALPLIARAAAGDLDRAQLLLTEAAEHAERIDMRLEQVAILRALAAWHKQTGDDVTTDEILASAFELATAIDARGHLQEMSAQNALRA